VSVEQRRDQRFRYYLEIKLHKGAGEKKYLTDDVSYRGFLLHSDEEFNERQLVRFSTRLPPDDTSFRGHALVVHKSSDSAYGFELYGTDKRDNPWERFIREVARFEPPSKKIPEREKRATPRFDLLLPIRAKNLSSLEQLYTRDISASGIFIHSEHEKYAVDQSLQLELLHPSKEGSFNLGGIITRVEKGRGIAVELADMNETRREELWNFVEDLFPDDFHIRLPDEE
jgi:hypothetical protein